MIGSARKRQFFLFCMCAFLLVGVMLGSFSAAAQSSQATGIDFQVDASFDPYASGREPSRFLKGLAKMLDSLHASGHAVIQGGQVAANGNLDLNGISAIDFRLAGFADRLSLATNLFGKKPVVLTMPNYMPFLLKMNSYFDVPVQYIGVFTDPYSYLYGIRPVVEQWTGLTGGAGNRVFTSEECIGKAEQFSQEVTNNQAFYFWYTGLLQYVGLDEPLTEFLYSLPDWTASLVEEKGLSIQTSDQEETWTLGDSVVYQKRQDGDATLWQLNLPEWEGYQLTGTCSIAENAGGIQLSMDWKLYQEGGVAASLTVSGLDLPDGKRLQGRGTLTISLGGEALGNDKTYTAELQWNQTSQEDKTLLEGQVVLLHPETGKAVLTVAGQVSWGNAQEGLAPISAGDIQGIDFFCMNDMTIQDFYADAKQAVIRSAIPFLVELPAGFIDGVVDWMDSNGMLTTLLEGIQE